MMQFYLKNVTFGMDLNLFITNFEINNPEINPITPPRSGLNPRFANKNTPKISEVTIKRIGKP